MPSPSAISKLPEPERLYIEKEIVARNFADYDGLVIWLKKMGFEISRSSAYRHANKMQKRLQAVKNATEAARLMAETAEDGDDSRSAAVIAMAQTEMFDVMVALQELDSDDPAERVGLLAEVSKMTLNMTRASTLNKRYQLAFEKQIREQAAQVAETVAKSEGVTEDGLKRIREKLGLDTHG